MTLVITRKKERLQYKNHNLKNLSEMKGFFLDKNLAKTFEITIFSAIKKLTN